MRRMVTKNEEEEGEGTGGDFFFPRYMAPPLSSGAWPWPAAARRYNPGGNVKYHSIDGTRYRR